MEEMRRVLAFLQWKAVWWRQQSANREGVTPELRRGLRAYAEKQAGIFDGLRMHFASMWVPYLRDEGIIPDWARAYKDVSAPGRRRKTSLHVPSTLDVVSEDEGDTDAGDVSGSE